MPATKWKNSTNNNNNKFKLTNYHLLTHFHYEKDFNYDGCPARSDDRLPERASGNT